MAEICRLCASFKTTDLLVPLLDPTHSIPAKVEKCCRINISNEMDLPQNVCKGCLDTLNMSHAFAETVAMAQNTLRKAIASRSITASSVTQPFRSSQNFDRIIKWDQRKDEEIENDVTLKLQAMKMYLGHMSNDQISENLGVPKSIVEKWMHSFKKQRRTVNSDCEMVYEIHDNSSNSNDEDEPKQKHPINEFDSSLLLRWSGSSESDDARSQKSGGNSGQSNDNNESRDHKRKTRNIAKMLNKSFHQLRTDYKRRIDLKRWRDVPCKCTTCKEKFVGINDLRLHVNDQHHHARQTDPELTVKHYGCGLCFKMFNLFTKLIHHAAAAHVSHLRLCCFVCDETSTNQRSLDVHMNSHQDEEITFPCKYCDRSYRHPWNVRRHQVKDHSELLKFMCRHCNEDCADVHALVQHVATHAAKDGEHICNHCGYTTKRQQAHTKHIRSHRHIVSYDCETCGKRFKKKKLYQAHIRSHHRNAETDDRN